MLDPGAQAETPHHPYTAPADACRVGRELGSSCASENRKQEAGQVGGREGLARASEQSLRSGGGEGKESVPRVYTPTCVVGGHVLSFACHTCPSHGFPYSPLVTSKALLLLTLLTAPSSRLHWLPGAFRRTWSVLSDPQEGTLHSLGHGPLLRGGFIVLIIKVIFAHFLENREFRDYREV